MDLTTSTWKPIDIGHYTEKMPNINASWIERWQETTVGHIPIVKSRLSILDRWGFIRIRWGMMRMDYRIPPGLYGIGRPDENAPVLVTSNFKMTFDIVRKSIPEISAWILVLDTNGINVWCAAGKGTFGTEELISKIETFRLHALVNHKQLILPQLGGVGIAAHTIIQRTKFRVLYGPVYAKDIPEFIANKYHATPKMRRINFTLRDRLALLPMELVPALKFVPLILIALLVPILIFRRPFLNSTIVETTGLLTAVAAGSVLFQILLPWLPGRSFAVKGWILGMVAVILFALKSGFSGIHFISYLLFLPPITVYLALNFTGSTTFTSQSGVYKDLKMALPVMIVSILSGYVLKFF